MGSEPSPPPGDPLIPEDSSGHAETGNGGSVPMNEPFGFVHLCLSNVDLDSGRIPTRPPFSTPTLQVWLQSSARSNRKEWQHASKDNQPVMKC